MNRTMATVGLAMLLSPWNPTGDASAGTTFPGEYLIVGTQANGGGGIYRVDGDRLTFIENLPEVAGVPWGARAAYHHEASDTLYFSEGDSPAEWSVALADLLAPTIAATATRIRGFDNRGGGEQHPDIFIRGPQDGEIYAHTRGGGRLWRYDPVSDSVTDMGAHTAATDAKIYQVVHDNTLYTHNGDDGFRAWDQAADGSWSTPYDSGISDVLNSHATAIRESDSTYFSGRSGTIAYGSFVTGGPSPGTLPRLDPISPLNSMDVSADGTKLWIAGFQPHVSPDTNYLGYFDISGDLAEAPFVLVVPPGDTLPGLTGNDWRISVVNVLNENCPRRLQAELGDDADVNLSWTNGNILPGGVDVFRDDELIGDDVPADPPAFTDTDVSLGLHTYRLVFDVGEEECGELLFSIDTTPPCDTHCDEIEVSLINQGESNVRVTATAHDDTDDVISYTFNVRRGTTINETVGPQTQDTAEFSLPPNRGYNVTVTVEDDSSCDPPAEDSECPRFRFTVPNRPACDTRCVDLDLSLDGAGIRAMAVAEDDSGDSISYTFRAEATGGQGAGPLVTGPQPENVAFFAVEPGDYAVSVSVSDGTACTPVAAGLCEGQITVPEGGHQLPGNCNQDGRVDLSDGICLLGHLFQGNPPALPCGGGTVRDPGNIALVDVNGDGNVDLSDGVHIFAFLFVGGPSPVLGRDCVTITDCPNACDE